MAKAAPHSVSASARKFLHQGVRKLFAPAPRPLRFAVYRSFVDCDPAPAANLVLKIAETREELEACFGLLHDAYVNAGFMQPDPSGMRVTLYHALPTTTTLCAKIDGQVVGTISLIRESVFGFPLQAIFDLHQVREVGGNIAEVSALAVHPDFRKTGGAILFPLMKFMFTYCATYFDTRHIVIAVNPNRIEMYESLLFFERLRATPVERYDFANGAPAVGASLDLYAAPQLFKHVYGPKRQRKNLHSYFMELELPNIQLPRRRYFTTNDPVMTPELLDYFFNQKTPGFERLDARKKALLHTIYNLPEYLPVLPGMAPTAEAGAVHPLRAHPRFSLKCPAELRLERAEDTEIHTLDVIEISSGGFQAHCASALPQQLWAGVWVHLGEGEKSTVRAMVVRAKDGFFGFKIESPDAVWQRCVRVLESGTTHAHAIL
ncbi:GNAT family N-acetyltransferase [Rhodoferax sp.]|uniref:GNAT family N-acetyltransferase n=1 Tax=Rhodoferax sp. TaxID=50421 RepID=UPI0025E7A16B|nr:GNAT family N-acetyltransferase [Rhodoferax sp.]